MATTFIMTAVLLGRTYGTSPSVATRFSLVAAGILALLSKETAAVLPVLLLIDAWIRKKSSRTLLVDVGVLLALMGTVGAVRLALRFGVTSPPHQRAIDPQRVVPEFWKPRVSLPYRCP